MNSTPSSLASASLASASTFAPQIDHQFFLLLGFTGFLVLVVVSLVIFFCLKYRASTPVNRELPPTQPRSFEFILAAIILIFGLSVFFTSAKIFFRLYSPPEDAKTIEVVAKQWLWTFHDPQNPADKINEMTVTLGVPTRLHMISEDVVHSFYVPAFRVKQDVLPGRYTTLWFTPTLLGDFEVLCTQYCGLRHSEMRAIIHVVAPAMAAVDSELTAAPANGLGNQGEQLLQKKGCLSCHADHPQNAATIGPSLTHLFGTRVKLADGKTVVADETYLRQSILEPAAAVVKGYSNVMPSYQGQLSESEVNRLIETMKSPEKRMGK